MEKDKHKEKGDGVMGKAAEQYATFDVRSLLSKKSSIVSSKEALKDVQAIKWEEEVLRGERTVVARRKRNEEE